jgi:hypothetical protein
MIILEEGNIWDYYNNNSIPTNNNEKEEESNYIVCPTNIGWNNKKENIMGAGIAKEVKDKFPEVSSILGYFYRTHYSKSLMGKIPYAETLSFTFCYFHKLVFYKNIIFLPTKELNENKPWLSWKNNSSLDLIEENINNLKKLFDHDSFKEYNKDKVRCIIPMIGCGCGKLDPQDIIKILEKHLKDDDRFILIKKEKKNEKKSENEEWFNS